MDVFPIVVPCLNQDDCTFLLTHYDLHEIELELTYPENKSIQTYSIQAIQMDGHYVPVTHLDDISKNGFYFFFKEDNPNLLKFKLKYQSINNG